MNETYSVADAACSTSLLGDELRAEHLAGVVLGLFRAARRSAERVGTETQHLRLDDVYAALQAIVKVTLPASASKNLRLNDASR